MHAPSTIRRATSTLLVATALTTTIAACGSDDGAGTPESVPSGSVAQVADQSITKARFDRALTSRVEGVSPLGGTSATTPLDAPGFSRCIAAQRKAIGRATGGKAPSVKQLRGSCAALYQEARAATMTSLIQESWVVQQAAAEGIEIPDSAVAAAVKQYAAAAGLRKDGTALPAAKAQARFDALRKRSGLTTQDLQDQLRAQLAQGQLQQRLTKKVTPPTRKQARAFLEANPQLFGTPGTATVDLIAAKSPADAAKAKTALAKGSAVQSIVQELASAGQTGARQGTIPLTQGDGQLPPVLEPEVFTAKRGTVIGPVKVGDLYYVALVRRHAKGKVPPYRKVASQVKQQYIAQRAQTAQAAAQTALAATWRPRTLCAKGYVVPECSNFGTPTAPTTATTG